MDHNTKPHHKTTRRWTVAVRLGQEPLVWFCLLGAALFAIDHHLSPPTQDPRQIHVSEASIHAIAQREALRSGLSPDANAVRELVQRQINEEIMVRYGTELGLDEGDPIIRRRIMQQLQLLADTEVDEPSDGQLADYLNTHMDLYQREARWSIEVRSYGPKSEGLAAAQQALHSGNVQKGSKPLAFGKNMGWRSASEIQRLLGTNAVDLLERKDCRQWCGPIESKHGHLLIRASQHRLAMLPTLAQVRPRVRQRWMDDARHAARAARLAELSRQYTITIEWPQQLKSNDKRLAEVTP